jgi:hypothetical protein
LVVCSISEFIKTTKLNESLFPMTNKLPSSKRTIYSILQIALAEEMKSDYTMNPLVRFLKLISEDDIKVLQQNVILYSESYRYYTLKSNRNRIPLLGIRLYFNPLYPYSSARVLDDVRDFPEGGAINHLSAALSRLKEEGVQKIGNLCELEKNRRGHTYVHNYPCINPPKNKKRNLMNIQRSAWFND